MKALTNPYTPTNTRYQPKPIVPQTLFQQSSFMKTLQPPPAENLIKTLENDRQRTGNNLGSQNDIAQRVNICVQRTSNALRDLNAARAKSQERRANRSSIKDTSLCLNATDFSPDFRQTIITDNTCFTLPQPPQKRFVNSTIHYSQDYLDYVFQDAVNKTKELTLKYQQGLR